MDAFQEILEHIESLTIVDTHEHLPAHEKDRSEHCDVLSEWLTHYFSCDLVSAGLSERDLLMVRDPNGDLRDRWERVAPFWAAARSTGYGRSLALAARDVYDVPEINRDSIEELDRRFREARREGDHYRFVLKEKSRIAVSILDRQLQVDDEFFVPVVRLDSYIMPTHRRDVTAKEDLLGIRVHSLADWKRAMEMELERAVEKGIVGLKTGLAYKRSLCYEKVDAGTAEAAFNELFRNEFSPAGRGPIAVGLPLQNHMMHHMLALADERGLTVQVHTGIQEGVGNVITDSNPVLLTNLFLEYRNVTFDIFHMGYPYTMELSNLAKNFPNVCIDMCWGHIVSPEAARRALVEWLDAVPANKISAFGGDYCFVDGVYGHQALARRNVAASLARKVEDGGFDTDRAREVATWLFVDNPVRIFGLGRKRRSS